MNIQTIDGALIEDQQPGHWLLQVPVIFEGLATGPQGILQFSFRSVTPQVTITGAATVHHYARAGFLVASPEPINTRPVAFRDEGEGRNTLVFCSIAEIQDLQNLRQFQLNLQITFANLAFVTIPVAVEANLRSRTLSTRVTRRPSGERWRAVTNLALLLIAVGAIALSQQTSTKVYQRESAFLGAHMLSVILGSVLTFLGLSVGRLRAWFAVISDFVAVTEWPELHVNPTLYRLLLRKATLVVLVAVGACVLWFMYDTRSIRVPHFSGTVLADTENSYKALTEERVFVRDVAGEHGPRFVLICDGNDGGTKGRPFALARLERSGKLSHVKLKVTLRESKSDEMNAVDWLQHAQYKPAFIKKQAAIREVLCSGDLDATKTIGDERILVTLKDSQDIEVKFDEAIEWQAEHVRDWIRDFSNQGHGELKSHSGMDYDRLYDRRHDYVDGLMEVVSEKGGSGRIRSKTLVDVIDAQLKSVVTAKQRLDRKRAVEAGIIVQGLWQGFGTEKRLDEAAEEDIDRLVTTLRGVLTRSWPGREPFFALVEATLSLQASEPGVVGTRIQEALSTAIDQAMESGAGRALELDYAAMFLVSSASDDPEAPQWCHFRGREQSLQTLHGSLGQVETLIVKSKFVDEDGRQNGADRSERQERAERVKQLWTQSRSCRLS